MLLGLSDAAHDARLRAFGLIDHIFLGIIVLQQRKAVREADRRTSWTEPDDGYEAAVLGLAARALDDRGLAGSIAEFVAAIAGDALANSLGAKLIQLTMAGVPDIYQGCELSGLSLVDPDNRRPVDFGQRRALLADLDANRLDLDPAPGPALGTVPHADQP